MPRRGARETSGPVHQRVAGGHKRDRAHAGKGPHRRRSRGPLKQWAAASCRTRRRGALSPASERRRTCQGQPEMCPAAANSRPRGRTPWGDAARQENEATRLAPA
eukprot:9427655-Pyramimonas_sp.AAC.1